MRAEHRHLPKTIPIRLIEVGSSDEGIAPRIVTSSQISQDVDYLALSYAWGSGHDFAKTTASSLDEMTTCLPWDRLAKTVQDAVMFTRKLGFAYLWVDALCILQSEGPDDKRHRDDWSYEAARFGQYYENATVTIAASGAISSQQGLFLGRPALDFDPDPVTITINRVSGDTTLVIVQPPGPSWEASIQHAPLLSRGWAIQERVLSKRILHFGANSLLWECRECQTTEANPDTSDIKIYGWGNERFVSAFQDLEDKSMDEVIQLWHHFIQSYSRTDFSFDRDKLPALSGIAKRVQNRFPQGYIAGIWESAIPQGLLWTVWGREEIDAEPSGDINLPSWCWAAAAQSIRFLFIMSFEAYRYITLQVKSWSVKTNGAQTSGQILQAKLNVFGPVKSFNLYDLNLAFVFGPEAFDRKGKRIESEASKGIHRPEDRIAYMDNVNFLECINKNYICILVAKLLPTRYDQTEKRAIGAGLILQPTGRAGAITQYKRIGVLCLSLEEYWSNVQEEIVELV
ncbi:hypothetical protein FBEOM_9218 [Fusarium beomiforme]|uniref:Heterokaryon incompatibility domain-containing protein n=1 Tax=Fusarium beomiforme TaxID=44412 RepID=A0A9P5AEH7_9HYPO|nr:hypothetical protein FBEOM_9218 [Fusarium beomiforme]